MTLGVGIERHGAYDMLFASDGRSIPRKVRITFSNGATALYSDQFDVVPIDDPASVDAGAAGLSVRDFGERAVRVRFHDDAGPVFVQGRRRNDPMLTGATTYVVFGSGKVETMASVAMLAGPTRACRCSSRAGGARHPARSSTTVAFVPVNRARPIPCGR